MKNTRSLTQGAMVLGLGVVIMILNRYVNNVLIVFVATPFCMYASKYSFKDCLAVVFAATIIGFIYGSLPYLLFMFGYGFMGVLVGFAHQRKWSRYKMYGISIIFGTVLYLIMVTFYSDLFGINYDMVKNMFGTALAIIAIGLTMFAEIFIIKTTYKIFKLYLKWD